MPSLDNPNGETTEKSLEQQLFDAIAGKKIDLVKKIVHDNPKINLNCFDADELTPLQHSCHTGDVELAKFLIDKGADVNFTHRKDGYTALMFAAISARDNVVRLLLERGVDTTVENCVHRTAAQMAAFVGQSKIVAIINSWVPYETTIEPYTRCRELEDKPRIESQDLGRLLHNYIVYPSLHPVKLLLFIKDNLDLIKYSSQFIYVLENLSSKVLKPPLNEEYLSLKYYYLAYLIEHCIKSIKLKESLGPKDSIDCVDAKTYDKCIETIVRRLIKRDKHDDIKSCTQQLDTFILECVLKFPYTQLAIFKTMAFALTKREPGDLTALAILTQALNGPRMFSQPDEACAVCGEVNNKKCSKCKSIHYCGPLCQRADWFQHKRVCRDPEEKPLIDGDTN